MIILMMSLVLLLRILGPGLYAADGLSGHSLGHRGLNVARPASVDRGKADVACYARRTEKLTCEATLLRVTYCFFQGRFYTASLRF